jgi:hypothetical protein
MEDDHTDEATDGGTTGGGVPATEPPRPPEDDGDVGGGSAYSTSDSSGIAVGGVWIPKDHGRPLRPEDESICRPRQIDSKELLEEWKERTAASSAYRRDREQIKDARGAAAALANASSPDSSLSLSVSTDATSPMSKARERHKRSHNAVQAVAEQILRTIQQE